MALRPAPQVTPAVRRTQSTDRGPRIVVLGLIACLLMAAGVYTAWWFAAAGTFRDRAMQWVEQQRDRGLNLAYERAVRDGYPLRLGARFANARLDSRGAAIGGTAEYVRVTVPMLSDRTLDISLEGSLSARLNIGGEMRHWTGQAESFTAVFEPSDSNTAPQTRLTVRQLTLNGSSSIDDIGVSNLALFTRGDPAADGGPDVTTCQIALSAEGVHLPALFALPLGQNIEQLTVDAKLNGTLPRQPMPEALTAWRDAGGTLDLTHLGLVSGSVTIDGDGTLALDPAGQPIGAMTTRIGGWDVALDQLAADGMIPSHTAAAGKILLRAFATSDANKRSALVAPLSVQDRTLSVGPVPLLRLPRVHWLDPAASR